MSPAWYAVHVRAQHEKLVSDRLGDSGFGAFWPSFVENVRWSDRTKQIVRSYFPGYLFGHFAPSQISHILALPGVIQVLGSGSHAIAIPDADVEAIRALIESGAHLRVTVGCDHVFHSGEKVAVMRGSLRGVEGTILRPLKCRERLLVQIPMLNRTISAEMDRDSVRLLRVPA